MIKEKGGVNAAVFIEFLKRMMIGAKRPIFLIVDRGPAQLPTFCIPFSFCDDRLPLASVVWTEVAGITVSSRQGIDVHLHERAA
jgi:hypothetical protein